MAIDPKRQLSFELRFLQARVQKQPMQRQMAIKRSERTRAYLRNDHAYSVIVHRTMLVYWLENIGTELGVQARYMRLMSIVATFMLCWCRQVRVRSSVFLFSSTQRKQIRCIRKSQPRTANSTQFATEFCAIGVQLNPNNGSISVEFGGGFIFIIFFLRFLFFENFQILQYKI